MRSEFVLGWVALGSIVSVAVAALLRAHRHPEDTATPSPQPEKPSGRSRKAQGLLRAAVEHGLDLPVTWVEVPWEGLVVLVGAHALQAPVEGRGLRLPVSFRDAVAIARRKGWVLPTAELSDAIWHAASVRVRPTPQPPAGAMAGLAYVQKHNASVEASLGTQPRELLAADEGKDWILSPRNLLKPHAATNYGWRDRDGRPLQPLGPETRPPPHNDQHADYSQVLRPIRRRAKDGTDLLDVFEARGLPAAETARLRT